MGLQGLLQDGLNVASSFLLPLSLGHSQMDWECWSPRVLKLKGSVWLWGDERTLGTNKIFPTYLPGGMNVIQA